MTGRPRFVMSKRIICLLTLTLTLDAIVAPLSVATERPNVIPHGNCGGVFSVLWKHGSAGYVNAHGIGCSPAKHLIKYALNNGLLAPTRSGPAFFVLRHRRVRGFTFTADARDPTKFHARKRQARISFTVCWLNVDC